LAGLLGGWMVKLLVDRLFGCSNDCLNGRLGGTMIGWFVGWMVKILVDRLAG